jgi:hypothetical protein
MNLQAVKMLMPVLVAVERNCNAALAFLLANNHSDKSVERFEKVEASEFCYVILSAMSH